MKTTNKNEVQGKRSLTATAAKNGVQVQSLNPGQSLNSP